MSSSQPAWMAPLASCRLRTSCCVKTMSPCGPVVSRYSTPSSPLRTRGWSACMRPLLSTTPAWTRPASRSTTPEPQMPMGSAPGDGRDLGGLAGGVDLDALDGAGHGLHAVADLVALEGGAGGAAGHGDAAVVGEGDLGVGADVDRHARPLLGREARGGDHGEGVRADEPGDGRREVHAAVRVHVDAELTRAQRERLGRGGRERRLAEADGREAEGEVVHRRVAHHRHVADVVGVDVLALVERRQVRVDALAHGGGQQRRLVVLGRVRDAADDVLAVAHLRVLDRLLVDERAAAQVEQVGDDLGRADVDGHAVALAVALSRVHVDDALAVAGSP